MGATGVGRGGIIGDPRRTERLVRIARDQANCPEASYLTACGGDGGAIHGYYRFMENQDPRVNLQSILAPHVEQTKRRMRGRRHVYAIQDTTDLNFASRPQTSGLGVMGPTKRVRRAWD